MSKTPETLDCPECGSLITVPTDPEYGELECSCGTAYLYGKNEPENEPSLETVSAYYTFIAPEIIALQEKILLFNEQNPNSKLFTQEALDEAVAAIKDAKRVLEDGQD